MPGQGASPKVGSSGLCPFVHWGQNASTIFLKVKIEVSEKEPPDVSITESSVTFKAFGIGANGLENYEFNIDFLEPVAPEGSRLKVVGGEVVMHVKKATPDQRWNRLTKSPEKVSWIKVDFDRLDISEDEEDDDASNEKMKEEYLKKLMGEVMDTEKKAMADVKKSYLFSYNFFQLVSHGFLFIRVLYMLLTTPDYSAYEDVGLVLMISQLMSILEVVHPATGLIKSGMIAPFVQVSGRLFNLFIVIRMTPEVHSSPLVNYLFLTWSLVEISRYPFYMMNSVQQEVRAFTVLRYTLWIPLYPLGGLLEGLIAWEVSNHLKKTMVFSVSLPNFFNISFSFPVFLKVYAGFIVIALYFLMSYMWAQRQRRLFGKSPAVSSAAKKKQ